MNVEVTKLPESRVALKIELTPDEVEGALQRAYKNLVQRVNVPGFRRGKAPRSVVERMVGVEYFLHEATDDAVQWGYRKAIEQENLTPIDQAEINPVEGEHEHIEPGHPFRFEATVSVKPDVQLPDYHALHVDRETVEVTDEDVDELLREIRERNATLEPTLRSAQVGDVVTMNITGRVEGEEVLNREDYEFELVDESESPHPSLPGLSEKLVGVNRGDIIEPTLPLPDVYPDQELAGKTLLARAIIKEIKRKVLPDLNDELAQSVSQFQSLEELRAALRQNLELERRQEADEKLVNDALAAVGERTFVSIPPVLIDEEVDRMLGELRDNFARAGLDFEMYRQTANRSDADLRNEMRESATQNVKTSLVIGAVADAEGIEISNDEVSQALDDVLREAGISGRELRRLRSSNEVRTNIRSRVRRQRAIRRLVEIVSGEDVSAEAADSVVDQTEGTAEDTQENLAVEVAG